MRFFRSLSRNAPSQGFVDAEPQTLFGFLGWETHVSYEKLITLSNPNIKLAVKFTLSSRVARGDSTCSKEAFSTGRVATTTLDKIEAHDAFTVFVRYYAANECSVYDYVLIL